VALRIELGDEPVASAHLRIGCAHCRPGTELLTGESAALRRANVSDDGAAHPDTYLVTFNVGQLETCAGRDAATPTTPRCRPTGGSANGRRRGGPDSARSTSPTAYAAPRLRGYSPCNPCCVDLAWLLTTLRELRPTPPTLPTCDGCAAPDGGSATPARPRRRALPRPEPESLA
jgi:hypothetical protein